MRPGEKRLRQAKNPPVRSVLCMRANLVASVLTLTLLFTGSEEYPRPGPGEFSPSGLRNTHRPLQPVRRQLQDTLHLLSLPWGSGPGALTRAFTKT